MKSKLFFSEIYPGQEKNFQNDSFYDLSSFQYESLRQEIINYIYFRDRNMSIQEMERKKIMIEFLGEFCFSHKPMINALADYPYTELLHDFKSWCTETQISKLNYRYQRKGYKDLVDCNIVLENFKDIVRYSFEHDMRVEIEKARWDIRKLELPYQSENIPNNFIVNFSKITQLQIHCAMKRAVLLWIRYLSLSTVQQRILAMSKFSLYSIQVGVQYYADCVREAGCESPLDISRLQLSWQGYNYGNGYIGWALEHYGGYSLENALQFSQEKAAALGWPRYGDPQYVPHVQRYYSGGGIFGGIFGNGQIVQVAKQEVGSSNGEKYWRWYGFDSYVEWCACFVSWCGEQAGLIESGAMPKFSLCENGIAWFKSHGKWQETGGIPSAGSLVFFDWNGDGISDHVGIVEKYEGGIIYTVEGNTGTNIGGNNVRGVWKHSYSVGSATILGYGII